MIDVFPFAGLPVAVMGLGRSGLATARALVASDAEVWAWDDDEAARARAEDAGVPLVDLRSCDWSELTTLVLSPGIPHTHPAPHPVVKAAREAGCEVISDVELLVRAQRDASYVGVTGTNGKSTTTALIGHILELSGREVQIGGNLGTPVLELDPLGVGGTYVLEMSSYQLELTVSLTFDVAVLLNISPDHLDRHGGLEGYVAAKKLIFHRQTRPRTAVVGVDDGICRDIFEELRSVDDQIVVPISGERKVHGGVYVFDGWLTDDAEGKEIPVLEVGRLSSLPGRHNWQNAAAAYAAAKAAGVAPPVIGACINSFAGLPHRQQLVAVIDGVRYVNDSKATNPEAAARALACYEAIYWIAGGRAKEGGLDPVFPFLGNVVHVFLIGEAESAFAAALEDRVPCTRAGDLASAVEAARQRAVEDGREGAVVLLSPAAASFDQFSDFEARGEAFVELVEALPGTHEDIDDLEEAAP